MFLRDADSSIEAAERGNVNLETLGTIVVCGATGRQGGAVARHLVKAGWSVRGLTRSPEATKARRLDDQGIDVVQADMEDRASLDRAFEGAYGVYSVQNPMLSGFQAEVQQGVNVADAARAAGVQHLVYGSAGIGSRTALEETLRMRPKPRSFIRETSSLRNLSARAGAT